MPVMDEFKEEREALKHGTPKQKISYFFCYYKWHVIIIIAVIAFAVSFIHQLVTQKDNAFFAVLVNTLELDSPEEYVRGYTEYADIDTSTYNIMMDTTLHINPDPASYDESTMAATQKIMVYIAAQEIDIVTGGEAVLNSYAYNDTFYDLREFLTPEQITKYEPYFYYMDMAVAEARDEILDSTSDYTNLPDYPDPRKPEAMENPVPVGIYLENADSLKEYYYFTDENVVLAVTVNAPHPEAASKFIDYIFQQ